MKLVEVEAAAVPNMLRALTTVARAAKNGIAAPQRALLEAIPRILLSSAIDLTPDLDAVADIDPEELVQHGMDAAQATQLVRLMIVMAIAEGPPTESQAGLIRNFASALSVDEPGVSVFGHLAKGRMLRFKAAFARRSHVRVYLKNTRRLLKNPLAILRALLRFRGVLPEDKQISDRYRALGALPGDTLGRQFFEHCRRENLPLCGEKGGFPPGALYHDFTHVLAGYDTSPSGEMKAAAFQGGFTTHDCDFFTVLFGLLIHTAGINMTPFEMPVLLGRIGQDQLALEVLHALERGAAMNTDLGADWDFWDDVERPIDEVRARMGIAPIDPVRVAA